MACKQCKHEDIDDSLWYACGNGHLECAKWCAENGATNFNWGLRNACFNGHLDIAKWCAEKGATDFNNGLENACYNGQLECVKWCLEQGATKCNAYNCKGHKFIDLPKIRLFQRYAIFHIMNKPPLPQDIVKYIIKPLFIKK